ncbi:hypothetical protein [Azospirillum ramasamyi]|uniref:Uncharacterized protein n=1 Tax=Azospirillum ramasamyi TaxID=682998 RepID=A0A2U9S616_9PROT|nr:hypothetical protein [Azospirillum ramasamyi]AWU95005.1 hypothetical protein DM194_12540 [Azospirillum ramasamyi]
MLHINDIEAFARINEALNEDAGTGQADHSGQDTAGPAHPALVMAMLATGRLPLSAVSKSAEPLTPLGKMLRRS